PQAAQLQTNTMPRAAARVCFLGPVFAGKKANPRRHLTEFWMVEPEMAWADLEDVKKLAEGLIMSIVGRVLDKRREELKVLERDVAKLESVAAPFPRVSYDEAVKILQANGSEIQWGGDFGGADETILTRQFSQPI